jgi:ferritin
MWHVRLAWLGKTPKVCSEWLKQRINVRIFLHLAFLNPFHMEQVDAETKIGTILAKVKDEQKPPGLLRQLDHELGQEAAEGA